MHGKDQKVYAIKIAQYVLREAELLLSVLEPTARSVSL